MAIKRSSRPKNVSPRRRVGEVQISPDSDEPRIMSAEEKRELILAHAEARQPMDPFQRMTAVIGVIICVVFVAGAWLYTLDGTIKKSFAQPMDPGIQHVVDAAKGTGKTLSGTAADLKTQAKTIEDRLNELSANETVLNALAAQIASTSSTSRNDLFKPATTSSTPKNK